MGLGFPSDHRLLAPYLSFLSNRHSQVEMDSCLGVKRRLPSTIVAIDFGTHGTGFAFSLDRGRTMRLHHEWPDQPIAYPKTLTALLYKDR